MSLDCHRSGENCKLRPSVRGTKPIFHFFIGLDQFGCLLEVDQGLVLSKHFVFVFVGALLFLFPDLKKTTFVGRVRMHGQQGNVAQDNQDPGWAQ